MERLVQLQHQSGTRRVAAVEEPNLILLDTVDSIYELAVHSLRSGHRLLEQIKALKSDSRLSYDEVYSGKGEWQLLPGFDHPNLPSDCLVSGTGLTHKNSALNRQVMHESARDTVTDSLVMYRWGLEGGRPLPGQRGVQPEWFYKGNGHVLRAHGAVLESPFFADDGGEEPEIAAIYIVDGDGVPRRIGFCAGNEFSDHKMEKKNYLYLAPSKLRACAIGPELVISEKIEDVKGEVAIERGGEMIWSSAIASGEENMAHSLENLEFHHFKYPQHRIPFQAHVHFLGADAFSFGSKVELQEGDKMKVYWEGFGRPLVNVLGLSREESIDVNPL